MKRRTFLKQTGLLGLGLVAGSALFKACKSFSGKLFPIKNYVWITPEAGLPINEWRSRFSKLKEHGIDGAIVQVYSSHKAWYETPQLPVQEMLLEQLIDVGKETDLEIHAWIWTMPNNNPYFIENHPEFYAVNGLGKPAHTHPAYVNYYRFMCPNRQGVQQFLLKNVDVLTQKEGLTGIHFDYIRMPDVIIAEALQPVYNVIQDREYPEYDYCYCEVCRNAFKKINGIDPLKDLADPAANTAWRHFRYDSITRLVNDKLIPEAKKTGMQATAAVFPNWESVRQEWSKWNMDAFFPMLYHNFYNAGLNWIAENLKLQVQALSVPKPIYSGLFVPALDQESLPEAVTTSLAAGASGCSLFSYHSMSDAYWDTIKQVFHK